MLQQIFVGSFLIVATVVVHAICLEFILKTTLAVEFEVQARWRTIASSLTVLAVSLAHILEIWLWAVLYYFLEEIPTFEAALYFSTSSFTTVGFGDITLSEEWRLLSSLESVNGMILFGWSTAFIFAYVRRTYMYVYKSI